MVYIVVTNIVMAPRTNTHKHLLQKRSNHTPMCVPTHRTHLPLPVKCMPMQACPCQHPWLSPSACGVCISSCENNYITSTPQTNWIIATINWIIAHLSSGVSVIFELSLKYTPEHPSCVHAVRALCCIHTHTPASGSPAAAPAPAPAPAPARLHQLALPA